MHNHPQAATEIEEALHDLWKAGNHHEYNNKLRHLVFNCTFIYERKRMHSHGPVLTSSVSCPRHARLHFFWFMARLIPPYNISIFSAGKKFGIHIVTSFFPVCYFSITQ